MRSTEKNERYGHRYVDNSATRWLNNSCEVEHYVPYQWSSEPHYLCCSHLCSGAGHQRWSTADRRRCLSPDLLHRLSVLPVLYLTPAFQPAVTIGVTHLVSIMSWLRRSIFVDVWLVTYRWWLNTEDGGYCDLKMSLQLTSIPRFISPDIEDGFQTYGWHTLC